MVTGRSKLVMTLLVRDEEDIIRHNIDFHLNQGVDFIIATDNGSVDGTREILVEYEKRGVLHLLEEPEYTAREALWLNRMGRIAFEDYKASIIFHCPADEFWESKTGNLKDEFLKEPGTNVLVVNLVNVLLEDRNGAESFPGDSRWAVVNPIETDNFEEDSKGKNLYLFRYPPKVIFKTNKKFFEVTTGNHAIANLDGTINQKVSREITIYHYPLRNKPQFFTKVKNFGIALETYDEDKKTGWHIRRWFASHRDGFLDREYKKLTLGTKEIEHLLKTGRIEEIDFERFTIKKYKGKASEAIADNRDAMKKGFTEHSIIFDSPVKKSASAWIIHTPFAFFLVSILKPKSFVELGVHTGHSYNAFCQAVKALKIGTCCYGIDTWKGDEHAGFYGEDVYQQLLEYQLKEYSEFSHLLRMTFDEGLAFFSNQGIDLLHIDGLHTYEAVRHDFEEWLPKMSNKGIILLHDTMVRDRDFGVWRLWNEIASKYPSFNFTHGYGLGIVAVGSNVIKEFLDFLNEATANPFYQKLFFSLGMLCSFDAFVEERDTRIGSLEEAIRGKESEVEGLRSSRLAEKEGVIGNLNEAVARKDAHISQLKGVLGKKETEIDGLKAGLAEKEAALNNIYSSHGWKGLLTYYKVRNSLLPLGTRRRQFTASIFKLLLRVPQSTSKVLFRPKGNHSVAPAEGPVREEACETLAVNSMLPAAIPLFPQSFPCLEKQFIPHERILQVSIVIPTKNAGPLFRDTLEGLKAQNYDGDVELIVIDSGSTDDTLAMALQYGATIISTRPAEFDHGLTRNQAIDTASGEIIVLISQDVLPGDQYLIRNFVKAFEDPLVAGAYARQLPRQDADIITKRNLNNWLTGRIEEEVRWIKDWTIYRNWSPFERYYFCNFDNVCSAIRKSVWEDIPFVPNQFGEDIDWAQKILEAGWKIAYWPSSFVIHSHSCTFMYEYRRNYLCHKKLFEQFGIHTVPSWKNIFLSTIKSTILDWKYTIHNEKQVGTMLKLLMETPFINIFSVYGQHRGAKAGKENTNATSNLIGRKKRIILTVHQFLPDYSSGTEILTYETAKELQKAGHDVVVFTGYPVRGALKDDVRFDRYIFDGILVERFKHSFVPMGDQSNIQELEYNNRLFRKYFTEYLKKNKPDIVHFFHLSRLSASAIDACIELGIPMVLTPTDFWFICPTAQLRLPDQKSCPGPNKLSVNCVRHVVANTQPKEINRLLAKIPDWLLAIIIIAIKKGVKFDNKFSPLVHALVNRRIFLRERMRHIHKVAIPTQVMMSMLNHNGLDESRTTNIPFGLNLAYLQNTKRPEPNNVLHLGYIGTLSEHKGVHILAKAITQLAGMPIELKIYGKVDDFPDYVEGLKNTLQGDPRVKFCGTFPNPQIGSIFSELDALVVPSLWYENSPLVVYSAQAAGCPVIGSNMDGISEVIEHGVNGLLFKAGNVSELAIAIESLINDKELLKKLSKNSRKPLSIEEYAVKLLDIYSKEPRASARGIKNQTLIV